MDSFQSREPSAGLGGECTRILNEDVAIGQGPKDRNVVLRNCCMEGSWGVRGTSSGAFARGVFVG